jgi:hypothetical protein
MMTRSLLVALFVLVAPALSAQRVVRESAAAWRAAPRLTLSVSARWCGDAEAAGCDFPAISEALALDDGGLIALNYSGPIRRFAADGRLVGELSRRARGPGEYRFVSAAALDSTGLLAWYDQALRRVATLSPSGKAGPVSAIQPPVMLANVFMMGRTLVVYEVPSGRMIGDTVSATYRTIDSLSASRTLARVRTPSLFAASGPPGPPAALFAPRVVSHVGWQGDVAHSNGGSYTVQSFPVGGAPWTLVVELPPRAVTTAERDSAVDEVLREFKAKVVRELPPAFAARVTRIGKTVPPLEAVRVLRDGTIWIRPTPARGAVAARWDIFSRSGVRLGQATLPLGAEVRDGTREWVLVTELGQDDVPMVVRYAVER